MIDVLQRLNDTATGTLAFFRNDSLKQKEKEEALKKAEEKSFTNKMGKAALYTVGGSALIMGGIAVILPAVGFTSVGVAAGSMAAAWQATFCGTVAAGSSFAILQSVGAAGIAATTKAAIVGTSAAASLYATFSGKEKEKK